MLYSFYNSYLVKAQFDTVKNGSFFSLLSQNLTLHNTVVILFLASFLFYKIKIKTYFLDINLLRSTIFSWMSNWTIIEVSPSWLMRRGPPSGLLNYDAFFNITSGWDTKKKKLLFSYFFVIFNFLSKICSILLFIIVVDSATDFTY